MDKENKENKGIALYLQGLTFAPTKQEIDTFVYTCEVYQLDPNFGEAHLVPIFGKNRTIVGHSALLKIAHRTGNFAGMVSGVVREGDEFQTSATGVTHRRVIAQGAILGAYCAVTNSSMNNPVISYVDFTEFNTGRNNWLKMPGVMITKVAEAFALRRAFHISGVYIHEEMDQMENSKVSEPIENDTIKELRETAAGLVEILLNKGLITLAEAGKSRNIIVGCQPDKLNPIIDKALNKIEEFEALNNPKQNKK